MLATELAAAVWTLEWHQGFLTALLAGHVEALFCILEQAFWFICFPPFYSKFPRISEDSVAISGPASFNMLFGLKTRQ
jgi:hypothetical protein